MAQRALWGGLGADWGSAARSSDLIASRPLTGWQPSRALWGGSFTERGQLPRSLFKQGTGTYSELVAINESIQSFATIVLPSFSMLVQDLDAYVGLAFAPHPYSESIGVKESYIGRKAGFGTYSELVSINESFIGQPSATPTAGQGAYREIVGANESYIGKKAGRGSYYELVSIDESYAGVPGAATPPPDTGVLSDEPLSARIGPATDIDKWKRLGPPKPKWKP